MTHPQPLTRPPAAGIVAAGLLALAAAAHSLDTQAPIADASAEDLVLLLGGGLPNRAFTRTAPPDAGTHLCRPVSRTSAGTSPGSSPGSSPAPGLAAGAGGGSAPVRASGTRTLEVLAAPAAGSASVPPDAAASATAAVPYAGDTTPGVHLDVRFAFGSDRLSAPDIALLDKLAEALRDRRLRTERFAIAGHTDVVGPATLNLELSCARALAVAQHLRDRGVEASRLSAYGFGSTRLLGGASPTAAVHRRVEIRRAP